MTKDIDRNVILEGLRNGSVLVVFTKADGTSREMPATPYEALIPPEKRPKKDDLSFLDPTSTFQPSTQRVFDLGIGDWRSFRWDRVTDYFINATTEDLQ